MSFSRGGLAINEAHTVRFIRLDYIHIRCLDPAGNPMAGRDYEIELPDGTLVEGQLDDDGWARHDDIRPGECVFKLKGEPPTPPPVGTHYVDVVVKDEADRLLTGEEFTVRASDGSTRTGKLDAEGRARVEELPPGPCWFALRGDVPQASPAVHHIRLQFMDEDGQPFANKPFEIVVAGEAFEGVTNDEGRVIADVPVGEDEGELTIWVDEDRSGESYTWPINISEVAS